MNISKLRISTNFWRADERNKTEGTITQNVTEQAGWGVNNIKDPPFFSGASSPHTRFALPAARRKTSLNARDWWKGKELFTWKLYKLKSNDLMSSLKY